MDLEKTLLRKVGEAVTRFKMIRDGDRVAVALSGGKDSLTMLDALLLLQKRAPDRLFGLRVHRGAGQIPAAVRADGGVSEVARHRLDLPSRQSFVPAARRTTRSRLRSVQPLPAPRGVSKSRAAWARTSSPSATPPTIFANRSCATRCSRAHQRAAGDHLVAARRISA